jgi:hypothetical protein
MRVHPVKDNGVEYVYLNNDDSTTMKCKHYDLLRHHQTATRTLKEKGVDCGNITDGLLIPTLRYVDIQLWLKRMRINLKRKLNRLNIISDEKMRYFACGEYGPTTFRPHYHILLWFNSHKALQVACETIPTTWKFGNIHTKIADSNSSYYVASYVNSNSSLPRFLQIGDAKPKHHGSRFLGQDVLSLSPEAAYEASPASIITRSLPCDGKMQDFRLTPALISRYFPKCRGYAVKDGASKLRAYRSFIEAKATFGNISLPEMAVRIADDCINATRLMMDGFEKQQDEDGLTDMDIDIIRNLTEDKNYYANNTAYNFYRYNISREYACYVYNTDETLGKVTTYFGDFISYKTDRTPIRDLQKFKTTDNYKRYCSRIYVDLLKSRHFIHFCCQGDERYETSLKVLSAIDRFYRWCDSERLKNWYNTQVEFYDAIQELTDTEDYMSIFDLSKNQEVIDEETGEILQINWENTQKLCPYFYDNINTPANVNIKNTVYYNTKRNIAGERLRKRTKTKKVNDACGVLRATA